MSRHEHLYLDGGRVQPVIPDVAEVVDSAP